MGLKNRDLVNLIDHHMKTTGFLRLSVTLLAMVMLSSYSSRGQDTIVVQRWDLNRCITYALENNIQVSKQKLSELSGQWDVSQAKARRLPSLNASVSQSLTNSKDFTNSMNGKWDVSNGFTGSLNSSFTIYGGGAVSKTIEKSKMDLEIARLNTEQAKNNITISITQAYLNVLYAKETYDYATQIMTSSEQQLRQAEAFYKTGKTTKKDLAEIQSQYAADEYSLVTAENALITRKTDLKQLLEISVADEFDVFFPSLENLSVIVAIPSKMEALNKAIDAMPEMKISKMEVSSSNLSLDISRAAYMPTLSLNGSIATNYSDRTSNNFSQQLSDNNTQQLGLTLSIPIFTKYSTKTSVAKSKIAVKQAELSGRETEKNLLQDVELAYQNVQTGQGRYRAAQKQMDASEVSYRLSEEQFKLGMLNTVELVKAKSSFLDAQRELTQSKYTLILNQKILDFYMGNAITL